MCCDIDSTRPEKSEAEAEANRYYEADAKAKDVASLIKTPYEVSLSQCAPT